MGIVAVMTDEQVIAQRCDREMMVRPHLWQHGPVLPLKRGHGHEQEVACFYNPLDRADFVLDVNLSLFGPIGVVERKTYPTVDAVLADGWIVD